LAADEPPAPAPGLRVLLIDDGAHRVESMRAELVRLGCEVVGIVDSAVLIHDFVARMRPDVVIVDSESPSRDTIEHLSAMSDRNPRPIVMFTDDAARETMKRALRAGVSSYVVAGMLPSRLLPVLNVAIARFEQEAALRAELAQTREELVAGKRIARAKAILMKERAMSEDDAHRTMRKLAMDRGVKLAEIAERIIDAHELLGSPPKSRG
jgi:response regulator NasT